MMNTRAADYKLVVIGDSSIGKTALLKKYIGKVDLGREMYVLKQIERHGEMVTVQIHDTMGQERFRTLTSSYYRGSHGCLLCFDVMNESSFHNLQYWVHDIKECLSEDIPTLLIGINRSDYTRQHTSHIQKQSVEISQKVPVKKIELFGELHKLKYMEVDLNNISLITATFDTLIDLVIEDRKRRKTETDTDIIRFPRHTQDSKKESGCQC